MYIKLKSIYFYYYYIMLCSIKTATKIIYISNIYIYRERESERVALLNLFAWFLLWTEVGHLRNLIFVISRVSEETSTTSQTMLRFPKILSLQSKISIWTRSFLDKWFELLSTFIYFCTTTIDSFMSYFSSGILGETSERRLMLQFRSCWSLMSCERAQRLVCSCLYAVCTSL